MEKMQLKDLEQHLTCEFCGKELKQIEVLGIKIAVRFCDCEKFQEKVDREAEEARLREQAEEEEIKNRIAMERIGKIIGDSGIRARFLNRTFETFEVNDKNRMAFNIAKKYADNFHYMVPEIKDGRAMRPKSPVNGLFITGGYGTGKTHLVAAISNQLLSAGIGVICMTMIDLLARIKNSFGKNEEFSEAEILKIYEDVPLLVIDDIGSEQPTEWGSSKIFEIVNARYENYMPTIITTNYTGKDLVKRMKPQGQDSRNAEKTLDRLQEASVGIIMDWESYRTKGSTF